MAIKHFKMPNRLTAHMKLSESVIGIGYCIESNSESVVLSVDDTPDPIYISATEAELMIASLRCAIAEISDLGPRN